MKIGIILPAIPTYSETFFRNKILGLQNNNVEVILFVNNTKGSSKYMHCEVIAAPRLHGNLFLVALNTFRAFIKALIITPKKSFKLFLLGKKEGISFKKNIKQVISNQFLLKQKLDWLYYGFGTMTIGREDVAKTIGARMAVSFRGFDITHYPLQHPNCYKKLWHRLDKIHVISDSIAALVYTQGFKNQCPLIKITPAIDTTLFFPNSDPNLVNQIHFVTVARLHEVKGLNFILEALAMLKKSGVVFNYTLIGSGPEENVLRLSAAELDLLDCITFAGTLSPNKVKTSLESADMYLQYSVQEGFCNAVLEAQAMGVLCVVSDAGGLVENVLNEYTGWVVPKCNPTALFQKLVEIMALDDSFKEIIRVQAVKRIQKEFNLQKQIQEFLRFYEKA